MIDPRYKHMKANIVPQGGPQSAPARPRGAFGGPPRRKGRGWDALKVLGGTLMDLDGSMGYGNREAAMQGLRNRNEQIRLQQENEARQAKMAEFAKTLTPEQQALFGLNPNAAIEGMTQQAFSQPETQDPFTLSQGQTRFDAQGNPIASVDPKAATPETPWYITPDGVDPRYVQAQNARQPSTVVNNNMGAGGQSYKSIAEVPEGQPIPTGLLGGYKPETGFFAIRDSNAQGGFTMVPFDGGKVARADENRQTRAERAGGTVVQDIGRALEIENQPGLAGDSAVGPIAGLSRYIPGTPSHRVHQLVESALSNIGIDQLQAMRDASPTGGALGQIPVQQQARLEQMLGSLQVQQNDDDWENNARRAMNIYLDIIHGEGQGPQRFDLGFDYLGRPLGARPEGLSTEEWFNMDPEDRALFE